MAAPVYMVTVLAQVLAAISFQAVIVDQAAPLYTAALLSQGVAGILGNAGPKGAVQAARCSLTRRARVARWRP